MAHKQPYHMPRDDISGRRQIKLTNCGLLIGGQMKHSSAVGVLSVLFGATVALAQDAPAPRKGPAPGKPERSTHRSAARHS